MGIVGELFKKCVSEKLPTKLYTKTKEGSLIGSSGRVCGGGGYHKVHSL